MRYDLDPTRSTLDVHASSSIHPIHTTAVVTGWIEATIDDEGRIDGSKALGGFVQLDISAMRSGNPLIDREAERRLDIRRFPSVEGELTRVEATGDDDTFRASGDLTFHGVTRAIDGTLVLRHGDDADCDTDGRRQLTVSGTTTIDVTDFAVRPPSLLVVKVHKEVRVELRATAVATAP